MQLSNSASQRGSAAVDFVLVAVPLVFTGLSVIAIALSSFALLVMRDSAIEGARFAALADQNSEAGCVRAREVAESAIGKFVNLAIQCEGTDAEEVVKIEAKFPIFGLISGTRTLTAAGRAPREN